MSAALVISLPALTGCGQPSAKAEGRETSPEPAAEPNSASTAANVEFGDDRVAESNRQVDVTRPPSDDRVLADVGGNKDGILEIRLDDKPGKKHWNSAHRQYFWEKYVVVKRAARLANFPDANLLVGGWARYEITGGKYHYREFKVAWNEYEGIPRPTDAEAVAFVRDHLPRFLGGHANVIVNSEKLEISMAEADEQNWVWHNANSVSFHLRVRYDKVVSNTEVATVDAIWQTRLYREAVDKPWHNLLGSEKQAEEVERKSFSVDEVSALPRGVPQ